MIIIGFRFPFSVVNTDSIREAEDMLHFLWRSDVVSTHAVILVANKIDLVRSRVISTQGKITPRPLHYYTTRLCNSSGVQREIQTLRIRTSTTMNANYGHWLLTTLCNTVELMALQNPDNGPLVLIFWLFFETLLHFGTESRL